VLYTNIVFNCSIFETCTGVCTQAYVTSTCWNLGYLLISVWRKQRQWYCRSSLSWPMTNTVTSDWPVLTLLSAYWQCWTMVCYSLLQFLLHSKAGWPQTWKTWNTQGFLWTLKTQGILRQFCAISGKNCNKQSIFSSSFKYLCKTAVDCVNGIIRNRDRGQSAVVTCYIAGVDVEWPLMVVIITFTFCCDYLWKSKFMALEKPGTPREFFLLLFGHPVMVLVR